MRKRDVYIAIMRAAGEGRGLHLTSAEVWELANDSAISTVASDRLTPEEELRFDGSGDMRQWSKICPVRDAAQGTEKENP